MPAIQIHTSSPINPSKASGVTPKTQEPEGTAPSQAPATTTAAVQQQYPSAQPGAAPASPTSTASAQPLSQYLPTPTQSLPHSGPPPPQPGAVPIAPTTTSSLPPPPKTGQVLPPQMSFAPPAAPYPARSGSSTISAPPPTQIPPPGPTFLPNAAPAANLSHPPGYHQDSQAAEFSSHQRAAHNASTAQNNAIFGDSSLGDSGEGLWGAAKKWASSAGESIAAAESKVWERINKE